MSSQNLNAHKEKLSSHNYNCIQIIIINEDDDDDEADDDDADEDDHGEDDGDDEDDDDDDDYDYLKMTTKQTTTLANSVITTIVKIKFPVTFHLYTCAQIFTIDQQRKHTMHNTN